MKMYWHTDELVEAGIHIPNFNTIMTQARFEAINKCLTFEDLDEIELNDTGDHAWKVRTITQVLKAKCRAAMPNPTQHLSIDEGMSLCTTRRCKLLHHVRNKPIDTGFKFFMLVDYKTKVCCDFNYYGSVALGNELRKLGQGLICTLNKNRYTPLIDLGGKKPTKTGARQRGAIKCAHNEAKTAFQIGFMDTAACYFLDTVYGTDDVVEIERKQRHAHGAKVKLDVPRAIHEYNTHMGGVDAFDQIRTGRFSLDTNRRANKWTVRYFEAILGIAFANTFNIALRDLWTISKCKLNCSITSPPSSRRLRVGTKSWI